MKICKKSKKSSFIKNETHENVMIIGNRMGLKNWFSIKKLFHLGTNLCFSSNPLKKQGILVFSHTSEVIQAEQILKQNALDVEIKGPPAQLQTGCDMVILFDIVLEPSILQILQDNRIEPLQVIALTNDLLDPVSLFHVKDYGDWLMVRAANMKITVEKSSKKIVNISGGGCPDVPYLAARLLNQNILEASPPKMDGKTLCSYSLQKAFEHAQSLLQE